VMQSFDFVQMQHLDVCPKYLRFILMHLEFTQILYIGNLSKLHSRFAYMTQLFPKSDWALS